MTDPVEARIAPLEVAARVRPGATAETLLHELLPWAASFAVVPVSRFPVGAVALGESGAVYAGANLEFAGAPLGASVHAEQSAVANAWLHGEQAIAALAVTAMPCGHCRQFLGELAAAERLAISVPGREPVRLADLLPLAFGPRDLGVEASLLAPQRSALHAAIDPDDVLAGAAFAAAEASYAPYAGGHAGVALRTREGLVVAGRSAECAAYNPTLPALQCALVALALRRAAPTSLATAVMVEADGPATQRQAAEALLAAVAGIPLRYVPARHQRGPRRFEGDSTDTSGLS